MNPSDIFFNPVGRLRSGWRLTLFTLFFLISIKLLKDMSYGVARLILGDSAQDFLVGGWGFIVQAAMLFVVALAIGWACCKLLESLPLKSLGWTLHQGWLRDFLWGSLIGALSLALATIIPFAVGGFSFSFNARGMVAAALKTLVVSGLIFIPAAAAEEIVFRGYPLQTLTRARLTWFGIVLTSIAFALVHTGNPNFDAPNVYPQLAFANTAIAGMWLAVAYLRTRSLWLPLGLHWSWNWTMGSVLGLPVSGITTLAPTPLLKATDNGPAWLTGGAYGIEGGIACTIAILLATAFIWRTKLFSATEELKSLTSHEIPRQVEKVGTFDGN